jgi:hypothetical protein
MHEVFAILLLLRYVENPALLRPPTHFDAILMQTHTHTHIEKHNQNRDTNLVTS